MAWRLGQFVVRGEINNTSRYSVRGWIEFRGRKGPFLLQLTGDCNPDLAGRHIRFEARDSESQAKHTEIGSQPPGEVDLSGLASQQIGPTGTMTAARKVKVADCPPKELYLRCKLDEPPPMQWKRCLYLEWYSQNGRVVVELADPRIEFVEPDEPAEAEADDSSTRTQPPQDEEPPSAGLSITSLRIDEDGNVEIRDETPTEEDADEECDDQYGLIPEELQRQFDIEAASTDRAIENDEDKPREIREMELMDDLIESGPGEPLEELFDTPVTFPLPGGLNDEEVEAALKSLLAQLALFNVSLDVCEHFAPRDAYRLLLEQICPEERAYPELRHTQWVQFYSTSDYCEQCQAEFEREHEEYERHKKENPDELAPPDEDVSDDDIPF